MLVPYIRINPSNCRPVSDTSIPSKICERSVRSVIMNRMTANNLFTECQFGFRDKRSCILQLLYVLDDFAKNFDQGLQTDTIYLDIKKAFDSVPHRRLLKKLHVSWIHDFLAN